jgi:hypothetical protein
MTDESNTSSAASVKKREVDTHPFQVLSDLVSEIVLVCYSNTLQIEYANSAFYKELENQYTALHEFLPPSELKKVKQFIRFCIRE